MANSKARFPKHIFVVQESGNDEEWLAIYAELADIPESAGEVATYELEQSQKLVVARTLV